MDKRLLFKKILTAGLGFAVAGMLSCARPEAAGNRRLPVDGEGKARNVIFLVADGMGLAAVTAARIFTHGPGGERLRFETLPEIGYQSTHAADNTVTDSAAAASAWAVGEKFRNGEISCHSTPAVCQETPATLLEQARQLGKATGLVATSTITHATPAAWAAHVHSRKCETEIARQYVEVTGVEILLGGGLGPNDSSSCAQYPGQDPAMVLAGAKARGYAQVTTRDGMQQAVAEGETRILGLFAAGAKTPETFRVDAARRYPAGEPTLPEMVAAALQVLEKDEEGLFLVVESSQLDWANHAHRLQYQIGETLALNETVEVVLNWLEQDAGRRAQTLVVVAADHETGGFAINGPDERLNRAGDQVEAGWTTRGHTGGDVLLWSQGPGSRALGRALDNTEVHGIIRAVLE